MSFQSSTGRRRHAGVFLLLVFGASGCDSGLSPVRGTVTLEDGKPLTKGLIVAERADGGDPIAVRGQVRADGSFELSTHKPGDGVPSGKYRVLINPQDMSDVPDEKKNLPFDIKYMSFDTSDLQFEVKPGPNEIPIKLAGGKKAHR